MPDWSRRQTLAAVAGGLAVAAAGCQGDASHESPSRAERRVEDYELERVRVEDSVALFTRGDELRDDRAGGYDHLQSADELSGVIFADRPEARTLRVFCADTDFESESVYLFARQLPACYSIELRQVEVDRSGPSAQFCRDLRPVDAECGADAEHTVGYAIRLPFPGDEHTGMGSGMSSSCSRPTRPEPFEANVTLSEGGENR